MDLKESDLPNQPFSQSSEQEILSLKDEVSGIFEETKESNA